MSRAFVVLGWTVRLAGTLALLLGLTFWMGAGQNLIYWHQTLGFLVSLALAGLGLLSIGLGLPAGLGIGAVLWALAVPALGSAQLRLLPGDSHWVVQVFHLLLGVGAIGLAELLLGRWHRKQGQP